MNILLLSAGGGGGNILRSLKALFARDVAIAHKTDAEFAARLRRAVTARFLDTNEFSLADVPEEERLLVGAATTRGLGSRHDPTVAARALEESREEIEQLVSAYSIVVTIGTGGKGTGAGTMFPLAEIVRRQNKLVVPVFVRPSFERHEVDKRRYDHALHVAGRFDQAGIRLIEILNDHAYVDRDPQPQAVVWERMNLPIARGLRGLIYVLWDLSQVDPSDLSILLAGNGRMRIGFGELDPPEGHDPTDTQIRDAVDACWQNPYCAFGKPAGTSLICIQGDWSNLADAKIKSGIAARALGGDPTARYNPLYARAMHTPKPWGVTALFTEFTGAHEPIPLAWTSNPLAVNATATTTGTRPGRYVQLERSTVRDASDRTVLPTPPAKPITAEADRSEQTPASGFATVVDLAKGLNRLDPIALAIAAGEYRPDIVVDGLAVRKLLGVFWFRLIFPRLSSSWQERLLDALTGSVVIPNHVLSRGRQPVTLAECSYQELNEIALTPAGRGPLGPDVQLVLAVMQLWGEEARRRLKFVDAATPAGSPGLGGLFGWRK
jgi:cell division GTPase FtsZ